MFNHLSLIGSTLALGSLAFSTSAGVIVSDPTALTWVDTNGSNTSEVGSTLVITTSKNAASTAALPSAVSIPNTGDYLTVTFDVAFDHVPANTTSLFEIMLSNSSAGGYFYSATLNPLTTTNGTTLSQTGDNNLGKANVTAFGTTTRTLTFTVKKVASPEVIELTIAGNVVAGSTFTAGLDIPAGATTTLNTVAFGFRGDAWNEVFSGSKIKATISNFSVTTNVPEPASLLLGLAGFALIASRRRRA